MIVEDNSIKMLDEEEYEILNDKIINLLEDLYLKSFRKEVKKFQIIAAGYNASEQKDLHVFNNYGWNVYSIPGTENINTECTFECRMLPKMRCWIRVVKCDETNILESEKISEGFITITVYDKDIIYKFIKQLDITACFYHYDKFGNDSLKYSIRRQLDGYYLDITCKI